MLRCSFDDPYQSKTSLIAQLEKSITTEALAAPHGLTNRFRRPSPIRDARCAVWAVIKERCPRSTKRRQFWARGLAGALVGTFLGGFPGLSFRLVRGHRLQAIRRSDGIYYCR